MTTLQRRWARVKAKLSPPPEPPPLPYIDAVELWHKAMGVDPDPWQAAILRSSAPRIMLNVTRQGGKSVVTAIKSLHLGLYTPKSLILIVSRSLRQSSELMRKVSDAYTATGRMVPPETESTLCLELTNQSRVIALPGADAENIRGYSGPALVCIDEAARCSEALWIALKPMVSVSQGAIIMLSTPWGLRGFFHREWTTGQGWLKIEVPATMCPRISAEFLAEERRTLTSWAYDAEYCCRFTQNELNVFSADDIEAFVGDGPGPLMSAFTFESWKRGEWG